MEASPMIAAAPRDDGLWSAYVPVFLSRLECFDARHQLTGRDCLNAFSRHMDPAGELSLASITSGLLTQYLARRKRDPGRGGGLLTASTLNKDIRYLNTALRYAQQPTAEHPEWLGFAPAGWQAPRLKRLPQPKRRPQPIPELTLSHLLAACAHATRPRSARWACTAEHWAQSLWLFVLITGLRIDAVLNVPMPAEEWLVRGVFPLPAEFDKAQTERRFHLPSMLVRMLREIGASEGEKLFDWPCGVRQFYRWLHGWQTAAGIPAGRHALPHGGKRTKGTLLAAAFPLPIVSEELSHGCLATTMQYYIGQITQPRVNAVESLFAELPIPDSLRARYDDPAPVPPAGPAGNLRLFTGEAS
jgi:integrase